MMDDYFLKVIENWDVVPASVMIFLSYGRERSRCKRYLLESHKEKVFHVITSFDKIMEPAIPLPTNPKRIVILHDADRIPVNILFRQFLNPLKQSTKGILIILTGMEFVGVMKRICDFHYPFSQLSLFGITSKASSSSSSSELKGLLRSEQQFEKGYNFWEKEFVGHEEFKRDLESIARKVLFSFSSHAKLDDGRRRDYKGYGGILLHGPPGTGKTFAIKALTNHLNNSLTPEKQNLVTLVSPRSSDLIHSTFGTSELAIRELFQRCLEARPCILFLDEIESIFPEIQDNDLEAIKTNSMLVQFMMEFDKLSILAENMERDYFSSFSSSSSSSSSSSDDNRYGLLIIGATNHPHQLSRRLYQTPGRFDHILELGYPDDETRRLYAMKHNCPDHLLDSVVNSSRNRPLLYIKELIARK